MIDKLIKFIIELVWQKIVQRFWQFFKFCIVGLIGAVIDIGVLYVLVEVFSVYYLLAATISFVLAVINNYLLNKYWTFHNSSRRHLAQFVSFLVVSLIGLAINLGVMYLMVERMGVWYLLAKAVAIVVVLFWNFIMNKKITFRKI